MENEGKGITLKPGDLVVFFVNQFGEYNMTSFHSSDFESTKTFVGKVTVGIIMPPVPFSEKEYITFCRVFTPTGTRFINVNQICLAEEFLHGTKQ